MWGVMEVRDASTLKVTHEKGFEEDVFQAQFHDEGKLCTLLTVRNYQSSNPWVAFQRFETTAWKERGDSKRKETCFGAFSVDGRLAMTREKGNEPGFGPTDEVVVWDLSRLDAGTRGRRNASPSAPGRRPGTCGSASPRTAPASLSASPRARLNCGTPWRANAWPAIRRNSPGSREWSSRPTAP